MICLVLATTLWLSMLRDDKSQRAHVAKFYGLHRLIRSVLRASNFSLLVFKIDLNFNFIGFFTPSILASTCFARPNLYASDFNLLLYFVWLSITDEGSNFKYEEWAYDPYWIVNTILKWCFHLSRSLFCISTAWWVLTSGGP